MSEFKNQPAGQFESQLTPANKIICQELNSVSKTAVIGLLLHGSLKWKFWFARARDCTLKILVFVCWFQALSFSHKLNHRTDLKLGWWESYFFWEFLKSGGRDLAVKNSFPTMSRTIKTHHTNSCIDLSYLLK